MMKCRSSSIITLISILYTIWIIQLLLLPMTAMVLVVHAQEDITGGIPTVARNIVRVRYGYFTESRPIHVGCGRRRRKGDDDIGIGGSWFDLYDDDTDTYYQVICYPQTSGNYALSRLDNHQLDISNLGSTPLAQGISRNIPIQVIYITQYMGISQGIYVRQDNSNDDTNSDTDSIIITPYDLRNKTIGVPYGSTMHYQLLFLLNLFNIREQVNVLNLAPSQIINHWNNGLIDGAACWGVAREHLLTTPYNKNNHIFNNVAKTLVTSNVLSDWGRPTFTNVVVNVEFAKQHPRFLNHFVTLLSRLNDSFLDKLGLINVHNVQRWDINTNSNTNNGNNATVALSSTSSYVPSLVDTLMISNEIPGNPTRTSINSKRQDLDLFVGLNAETQLSCEYLGSGGGGFVDINGGGGSSQCFQHDSNQYQAIKSTSEFLIQQKIIHSLGPLLSDEHSGEAEAETMEEQQEYNNDYYLLLDGSYLNSGQRNCGTSNNNCYPVGPFAEDNIYASKTTLLDTYDQLRTEPFPGSDNEIGRNGIGDSTCGGTTAAAGSDDDFVMDISGSDPLVGTIGDGANGRIGRSYSTNQHCRWIIRSVDCEPGDLVINPDGGSNNLDTWCQSYVSISFRALKLWSGDFIRIYTDPTKFQCEVVMQEEDGATSSSSSSLSNFTLLAQLTGHYYTNDEIVQISYETTNQNELNFYEKYHISSIPILRARGCMYIEFVTDANQERSYGDVSKWGDGFLLEYNRDTNDVGCTNSDIDCSGYPCDFTTGQCICGGSAWGSDCSKVDSCLGTNRIILAGDRPQESVVVTNSYHLISDGYNIQYAYASAPPNGVYYYPNDLDCSFEIQVEDQVSYLPYVEVTVDYDLEYTHDLLYLQTGAIGGSGGPISSPSSSPSKITPYVVLTGESTGGSETFYVPTDGLGRMSIRLTTDARGRRQGFVATVKPATGQVFLDDECSPGHHGVNCEVPYCISRKYNRLGKGGNSGWYKLNGYDIKDAYLIGRIVSQAQDRALTVRPMPWSRTVGGCIWDLVGEDAQKSKIMKNVVGIRLAFYTPLDLEPRPDGAGSIGDKLVIASEAGGQLFALYAEECESDEVCSHNWQTGICDTVRGRCVVRNVVEFEMDNVRDGVSARLITDRNDQGEDYAGLNFDALLVQQCPTALGKEHCEASRRGKCIEGYCLCDGGIPCNCPCDGDPPKVLGNLSIGMIFAIVVPLIVVFAAIFLWYRRRKILKSREQKHIIESKEAELEAFRNSVGTLFVAVGSFYMQRCLVSTKFATSYRAP